MNDNNEKIPLSPDDEIKSIRFAKHEEQTTLGNIENLCVAIVAGLYLMLLLVAISRLFSNFPTPLLWIIVVIFVLFFYLYISNVSLHINMFLIGSLTGIVAYFYSSDFYLLYPSVMPKSQDILQFYIYGLVFLLFSFVFTYIFRKKTEQWQVFVSLFMIVFILNSIITNNL